MGLPLRIWGDTCGGVRELIVEAFNFLEGATIEVAHSILAPLALLLFYLTVNILKKKKLDIFPPSNIQMIIFHPIVFKNIKDIS
jgi:hypothetical protein